MYLANPRRLLFFLICLLLALVIVWLLFLRGGSSPTVLTTPSRSVPPPKVVQEVLLATTRQPRTLVSVKASAHIPSSVHYFDGPAKLIAYIDNGELVNLIQGRNSWSRGTRGCYYHTLDTDNPSVANPALMYLPGGSPQIKYTQPTANTIDWSVNGSASKGVLTIMPRTHLLLSAVLSAPGGVEENIAFTYPQHSPAFALATPKRICKSTEAPVRILPRAARTAAKAKRARRVRKRQK
jgi:hypothetical protein